LVDFNEQTINDAEKKRIEDESFLFVNGDGKEKRLNLKVIFCI
jgi:hypothetical protein